MNCLIHIRQRYPSMAVSERKLADVILSRPETLRHLSSQQLAAEADVSQSSVVKFAQKLGFQGYPAFKLAIGDVLAHSPETQFAPHPYTLTNRDPLRLAGEKLIADNHAAMCATLNINSEEKLCASTALLQQARRILITGTGAAGLIAKHFAWKLVQAGFYAVAEPDMHALLAAVRVMADGDVLIAISPGGEEHEINFATDEALRNTASVLAITGFTPNALQQRASYCLYTVADDAIPMALTFAQVMLCDLLVVGLM